MEETEGGLERPEGAGDLIRTDRNEGTGDDWGVRPGMDECGDGTWTFVYCACGATAAMARYRRGAREVKQSGVWV